MKYQNMTNQCVSCGTEMPEGDQVCKGCLHLAASPIRINTGEQKLLFNWEGVSFEIPSTDWLLEAVKEKREREANQ